MLFLVNDSIKKLVVEIDHKQHILTLLEAEALLMNLEAVTEEGSILSIAGEPYPAPKDRLAVIADLKDKIKIAETRFGRPAPVVDLRKELDAAQETIKVLNARVAELTAQVDVLTAPKGKGKGAKSDA